MKEERYEAVLELVEVLIDGEGDLSSVMSTVSCELFHAFDSFSLVG